MRNQKGFSLIELLVVVAILGILGAAVFGFIVVGTRSYNNVSDEADLQYNAQLVVNQIENLVVDTSKGIGYQYEDEGGNLHEKIKGDSEISGSPSSKTLVIYNEDCIYYISWKAKELKLKKNTVNGAGVVQTSGSPEKMADNVTFFAVELDSSGAAVTISYIFESGKKTYNSSKKITLRNTFAFNASTTDMYNQEPTLQVSVDRVQINHKGNNVTEGSVDYWLDSGETIKLSAKVYGSVLLNEVIWSISGNSSEGTTISGGYLNVAEDETANNFVVTATSKDDTTKSASTTIKVKKITGISASIATGAKTSYYKGDEFTLTASIEGYNLSNEDMEVKWLAKGASITIGEGGVVSAKITANVNEVVQISAVCKKNDSYKASIPEITVAVTDYKITVSGISPSSVLNRNDSLTGIKAEVSPNEGYGSVNWSIEKVINNSNGSTVNTNAVGLSSSSGAETALWCTSSLNWAEAYTVYLTAYVEVGGKRFESDRLAVRINPVQVDVCAGPTRTPVTKDKGTTIMSYGGADIWFQCIVSGIKATLSTNANSSQYVTYASEVGNNVIHVKLAPWIKSDEAKIPILLNGTNLCYVRFASYY